VDDAAVAMLAATAELLAIDFYSRAIEAVDAEGPLVAYLRSARQNERDHYGALAGVLERRAPADLVFTYPAGTFASLESAAATGRALEAAFVGMYMGAVTALRDRALRALAARIGANEAQHLAALGSIAAGADMPLIPAPALPEVLTAREATEAVSPFLT
jgi:rubrerythrin